MFIDDYIEKVSLQEELKNVKEQLKAVQEENAVLRSSNLMIGGNAIKLKLLLIEKNDKIEELEAKIKMLESDRKDSLKTCGECSHKFQDRIKDLESEIDQLKKTPSAAADVDTEMIAIHTAGVETINKLNIQVHDLNNTITTLLDRLSKSTDENQELKKKVQELKDIIKDLGAKLYK